MGRLVVDVKDCRNDLGMVFVQLFATTGHEAPRRVHCRAVPVTDGGATATFPQLPPGSYAVHVFHDENGNETMDTLRGGLPTEGLGFSHNPDIGEGPPPFEEARFAHGKGDAFIRVRMRYAV